MGGIGPVQLLIVLAIILLLFGTKKLRNIGGDLGSAIKGFKKAISEDKHKEAETSAESDKITAQKTDATATKTESSKEKDQA